MSSYGSQHSGYLQYPPHHHQNHNQQQPNPPYPTTPQPTAGPTRGLSQQFYPPPQSTSAMYSSSPTMHQGYFSTSLPAHSYMHSSTNPPFADPQHRRSSSFSQSDNPHRRPSFPMYQSSPITIPGQNQSSNQYNAYPSYPSQPPIYERRTSHTSHHSHHSDEHRGSNDSYDGQVYGVLDADTLREYERRYAKDRELEKRPTLGGSLMSVVGKMGRAFGNERR